MPDASPVAAGPVAAIDCGTNSIRLLVATLDADGRFVDLDRRLELVRLGQGVDATRRFHPDALARTFAACEQFARVIDHFGASRVRFVATSAARDVSNRDEFFAGVRARLGVEPEVIEGTEEARLSFQGALSGVPDAAAPVLVVDIGGGSTELVVGPGADGGPTHAVSLDVGSVRLRERLLHDDPPAPDQVAEARRFIADLLDGSGTDFAAVATLVGVAGTVTSLSAIHQGLQAYDRHLVHGSVLTADDVSAVTERLLTSTAASIEGTTCLPARRAEVIAGGALVAEAIVQRVPTRRMVVCETDILDGIARALLDA